MSDNNHFEENSFSLADLEKRLVEDNPKLFEGIPKPKRQQIVKTLLVSIKKTHNGPIPDPESLEEYSRIIPNGAERIMALAEKQSSHRMVLEKKVIISQIAQSYLGQIFAFLIGIAALGSAVYCIINGREISGSIIGIGGITGLVTAFLKGREQQEKNLQEKKPRK
jgi:uncharacterized membrane protein